MCVYVCVFVCVHVYKHQLRLKARKKNVKTQIMYRKRLSISSENFAKVFSSETFVIYKS